MGIKLVNVPEPSGKVRNVSESHINLKILAFLSTGLIIIVFHRIALYYSPSYLMAAGFVPGSKNRSNNYLPVY
jgi:hypothetical protein